MSESGASSADDKKLQEKEKARLGSSSYQGKKRKYENLENSQDELLSRQRSKQLDEKVKLYTASLKEEIERAEMCTRILESHDKAVFAMRDFCEELRSISSGRGNVEDLEQSTTPNSMLDDADHDEEGSRYHFPIPVGHQPVPTLFSTSSILVKPEHYVYEQVLDAELKASIVRLEDQLVSETMQRVHLSKRIQLLESRLEKANEEVATKEQALHKRELEETTNVKRDLGKKLENYQKRNKSLLSKLLKEKGKSDRLSIDLTVKQKRIDDLENGVVKELEAIKMSIETQNTILSSRFTTTTDSINKSIE